MAEAEQFEMDASSSNPELTIAVLPPSEQEALSIGEKMEEDSNTDSYDEPEDLPSEVWSVEEDTHDMSSSDDENPHDCNFLSSSEVWLTDEDFEEWNLIVSKKNPTTHGDKNPGTDMAGTVMMKSNECQQ